jgi:hypothetical protein
MGWIVFGIVIVILAVITTVSQVLKGQQEAARPARRARARSPQGNGVRSSTGDIDRFLQEIDRLRKRPADTAEPGPRAKTRSTASPARSTVPVVEPVRARRVEQTPAPRIEQLPVASVAPTAVRRLPAAAQPPAPAGTTIAALGQVATSTGRGGPRTPFARNLVALLTSPQSMPMAVVLHEVLGQPKCKPQG